MKVLVLGASGGIGTNVVRLGPLGRAFDSSGSDGRAWRAGPCQPRPVNSDYGDCRRLD
jgi:hypothetical protein